MAGPTIPQSVREALGVRDGDVIGWDIWTKGSVIVWSLGPDVAYLESLEGALTEWAGDADEKAYRHL